jgi:DHA1 family bicyclomycin/chloramphenicol resistance-like MFS transporter
MAAPHGRYFRTRNTPHAPPAKDFNLHSKTLTATLAGLAMIGAFAVDAFLPSFPAIAAEFAVTPAVVQQTLSAYLLAFSFMSLLYGTLSDAFGRRPVILASLVVFAAASAGAAFAPSFGWLLACRVLQGLSAGAGRVIGQAVVRDRYTGAEAQRLMASITMVFGLAPAVAPIIGGHLHSAFGWRSVFVFLTAVGVLLLIVTWRFVEESLAPAARVRFHPRSLAGDYGEALRNPRFVSGALAVGCAFGGQATYISAAPHFVMEILRLPETAFAWLFVPMIGGLVIGAATGSRSAGRVAPARLLRAGFACMGCGALANLGYNSLFQAALPWAVLPIMAYSFGLGLTMPIMSIATLDLFPRMRGLAASLISFVQMLVFSLISGVIAPLAFGSAARLAAVVLGCFVLALGCWTFSSRPARVEPSPA